MSVSNLQPWFKFNYQNVANINLNAYFSKEKYQRGKSLVGITSKQSGKDFCTQPYSSLAEKSEWAEIRYERWKLGAAVRLIKFVTQVWEEDWPLGQRNGRKVT